MRPLASLSIQPGQVVEARPGGPDRPNWHFLVGSADDAQRMAQAIGIEYWFDPGHNSYLHDFRILLLDTDGRTRAQIDWDHMDEDDILKLLAK